MKKNRFLMVKMLVFVLLFKMTAVASYAENDPSLIGTWEGYDGGVICQFDGSNYQVSMGFIYAIVTKGTFTTNAGILTMKPTHFFGNSYIGLKEKWYSKNELEKDKDFAEFCSKNGIVKETVLADYFKINKWTYTVSFNKLNLEIEGNYLNLTKK